MRETRGGDPSGEKLHEEMITRSDAPTTIDLGDYYAITPATGNKSLDQFLDHHGAKPVPEGFHYASDNNEDFLTPEQIELLIREI